MDEGGAYNDRQNLNAPGGHIVGQSLRRASRGQQRARGPPRVATEALRAAAATFRCLPFDWLVGWLAYVYVLRTR